ncbi:uncharacterized protein PV09_03651 [Verruconis gallopava]|uniref:DUF1279 domain-containing protein n=1 Tax=Verruconis gallopava TaxID=253628 RepID=A0A0D2B198_9PEZI|nr:uncharacterized protein PV09_03651 [Verruconis gallopava]KIW05094.1 hypothetical protein PV09_03651 [Verruconis gallopava]
MMNTAHLLSRQIVPSYRRFANKPHVRSHLKFYTTAPSSQGACLREQTTHINKRWSRLPWRPKNKPIGNWRHSSNMPSPNPTPHLGSPEPAPSVSQRLKQLSREYGWAAVGWYFALSALDFPFCFLAVRALGTERIGQWEHAVIDSIKAIIGIPFPGLMKDTGGASKDVEEQNEAEKREGHVVSGSHSSSTEDLEADSKATIWTQLALAYAIHKSFIFIRVPLTAATLPKVVKVLRSWGWNIGKKATKGS